MEVVNKLVSPLEWKSSFSKVLETENYLFFYIVLGVLVHSVALLFMVVSPLSCRASEPDIAQQYRDGFSELRDLNSYVEVICASDVKTRHWYAYFVSLSIIVLLFVYGLLLKSKLNRIKQSYFLLNNKPLADFKDMVIKVKDVQPARLKKIIVKQLKWYMILKLCVSVVLITGTVTLLVLKYTIPGSRELFLPFENQCGPKYFWDSARGSTFDNGTYYCHFTAEMTVFMLMVIVDVYSIGLLIVIISQTIVMIFIGGRKITENRKQRLHLDEEDDDDYKPPCFDFWNAIVDLNDTTDTLDNDLNIQKINHRNRRGPLIPE